jgi:hypothetical protein
VLAKLSAAALVRGGVVQRLVSRPVLTDGELQLLGSPPLRPLFTKRRQQLALRFTHRTRGPAAPYSCSSDTLETVQRLALSNPRDNDALRMLACAAARRDKGFRAKPELSERRDEQHRACAAVH